MTTYTGTPRTWAAAEKVTATLLNAEVRDPLAALAGAWNSFTPTLAQGVSTDIAKTVTYAKYLQFGKLVVYQGRLMLTAAGTSGSPITVTLPVTAAGAQFYVIGSGVVYDATVATYTCSVELNSTTTLTFRDGALLGTGFAAASGDALMWAVMYEAA